jgi:hypothetical protein
MDRFWTEYLARFLAGLFLAEFFWSEFFPKIVSSALDF